MRRSRRAEYGAARWARRLWEAEAWLGSYEGIAAGELEQSSDTDARISGSSRQARAQLFGHMVGAESTSWVDTVEVFTAVATSPEISAHEERDAHSTGRRDDA